MRRAITLLVPFALLTADMRGQERVDHEVIARIKLEGFQRSAVMDTVGTLTDVHGPRLSGSPQLRTAQNWCRDQFAKWGLANAALESYGKFGRGWSFDRFSVEMTAPDYVHVVAFPFAWSPAISGTLAGAPVAVEIASKADAEKYRGKLRGAIVLNGRPKRADQGFEPEASRLSEDELRKQGSQLNPAASGFDAPKSYWDEERDWRQARRRRAMKSLGSFGLKASPRFWCRASTVRACFT